MRYKELNQILNDVVRNKKNLENLNNAYTLAKIIFYDENLLKYNLMQYNTKMSLNDSINLACSYIKSVNISYYNQFLNIINEIIDGNPTVKFQQKHFFGKIPVDFSGIGVDGIVYIDYENTLQDSYTFLHEMTHKLSTQYNENSLLKKIFGETSSIAMEFFFEEYLKKNTNLDIHDIEVKNKNRLIYTYADSSNIIFEKKLVDLYIRNQYIDESILNRYLNSLDKKSNEYLCFYRTYLTYLKEIIENRNLKFDIRVKYIIGELFSLHLLNIGGVNELQEIIRILGNSDLTYYDDIELLEYLKIPCIQDGNFKITNKDINYFKNLYKSKLKTIKMT